MISKNKITYVKYVYLYFSIFISVPIKFSFKILLIYFTLGTVLVIL